MLYGAIDVTPTRKAPDYFGKVTEDLKAMQFAQEAEKKVKEATEKASKAAMGDPTEASFLTTWDAHGGAAQQAAEQLMGMKDDLMKTEEGRAQWQTYLNELDQFIKYAEQDYKVTSPIAQNNMNNIMSGLEYEGRMHDTRGIGEYESMMDDDDNRNRYTVRFEGGHMVVDDGTEAMRVNDPRLFQLNRYDAKLERLPPLDPDVFYRNKVPNRQSIQTSEQAKQAVRDQISMNNRNLEDAVEWWVRNTDEGKNSGMSAKEVISDNQGLLSDALDAYVNASVENWAKTDISSKSKKPTAESLRNTAFNDSLDDIGLSQKDDIFVDPETGDQAYDAINVADYSFPGEYNPTIDTSSFPEESRIEDEDGLPVQIQGTNIIMTRGQIPVLVGSNITEPVELVGPVETSVKRQIDRIYGDGSYEKIITKLTDQAYSD